MGRTSYAEKQKNLIKFNENFNEEIDGGSSRGIAISGPTGLEVQLETLIRTNLEFSGPHKNPTVDELFGGIASGFKGKYIIAHALGLISTDEKNDIANIALVRNLFGHELLLNTFDDPSVKSICGNLKLCTRLCFLDKEVFISEMITDSEGKTYLPKKFIKPKNTDNPKIKFIRSVQILMYVLDLRSMIQAYELDRSVCPEFKTTSDLLYADSEIFDALLDYEKMEIKKVKDNPSSTRVEIQYRESEFKEAKNNYYEALNLWSICQDSEIKAGILNEKDLPKL